MGTTKSGRVLNSHGARGQASQFSVVHSNEGDYTKASKKNPIRLKAGGHGQTAESKRGAAPSAGQKGQGLHLLQSAVGDQGQRYGRAVCGQCGLSVLSVP